MRFLDADYARRAFPSAVAALPRPEDASRLVYFDRYVYLMDEDRYGYSRAYWMPINEIWAPHVRRIA